MSRIISNRLSNSNSPHESEMYEFLPATIAANDENMDVNEQSGLNTSISIPANQTLQRHHHVPKKLRRKHRIIHQHISQLRSKICSRIKNNSDNEQEKNQGYLVVEKSDAGLILLQNNTLDQESTQCAQPCTHTDEISFDPNQIQYASRTSSSNDLLVTQQQLFSACLDDVSNGLLTRPFADCNVPPIDTLNICDTQIAEVILSQSEHSTNDSNNEVLGTDRSIFSDQDYIRYQALDLERLKMLEIKLYNELNYLDDDSKIEKKFEYLYAEALIRNANLRQQLKELKAQCNLTSSPWICKFCTTVNEPSDDTFRFACSICESPSPLRKDI